MMLSIYLLTIFICLFLLFALSRHDFVLLRQNISLRQIFDNAFILLIISFVVARIFYIIYSQRFELIDPLKFVHVTKYWGILPYFGLLAIGAILFPLFRKKKNILRIFDIYFISFSPLILLDVISQSGSGITVYLKAASLLVLIAFYFWFIKIHNKFNVKDGFTTALIFITYSLVSLSLSFANVGLLNLQYAWYHIVLILSLIIFSIVLLLVQKDFFNK